MMILESKAVSKNFIFDGVHILQPFTFFCPTGEGWLVRNKLLLKQTQKRGENPFEIVL